VGRMLRRERERRERERKKRKRGSLEVKDL
jgi:hypothetical protein